MVPFYWDGHIWTQQRDNASSVWAANSFKWWIYVWAKEEMEGIMESVCFYK